MLLFIFLQRAILLACKGKIEMSSKGVNPPLAAAAAEQAARGLPRS